MNASSKRCRAEEIERKSNTRARHFLFMRLFMHPFKTCTKSMGTFPLGIRIDSKCIQNINTIYMYFKINRNIEEKNWIIENNQRHSLSPTQVSTCFMHMNAATPCPPDSYLWEILVCFVDSVYPIAFNTQLISCVCGHLFDNVNQMSIHIHSLLSPSRCTGKNALILTLILWVEVRWAVTTKDYFQN